MDSSHLAYEDSGGSGRPVVLLPGAGDLRTENRFLAAMLTDAGFRTIQADLPGHGRSPIANAYGVRETAAALLGLIDELDAGPVVVVANSFAPAAVVWAATEHPDRVAAVVAISPHFTADATAKGRAINTATRLLCVAHGRPPSGSASTARGTWDALPRISRARSPASGK